jgi:RNA polymerase sigma factor (TIGR02999 family)
MPPSPHDAPRSNDDSADRVPPADGPHVTELLKAWGAGDRQALDAMLPDVYAELHRQAERAMRREGPGHTLQPTALVNEAYLRLAEQRGGHWQSRAHFFSVASQLMRRILVDHARARLTAKRGAGVESVTLGHAPAPPADAADDTVAGVDLLALNDALTRLAELDAQQARVVELRYFGGLTIEETAAALEISPATVKREWAVARAWLRRELADGATGG